MAANVHGRRSIVGNYISLTSGGPQRPEVVQEMLYIIGLGFIFAFRAEDYLFAASESRWWLKLKESFLSYNNRGYSSNKLKLNILSPRPV